MPATDWITPSSRITNIVDVEEWRGEDRRICGSVYNTDNFRSGNFCVEADTITFDLIALMRTSSSSSLPQEA
jgi:hypothetical protein